MLFSKKKIESLTTVSLSITGMRSHTEYEAVCDGTSVELSEYCGFICSDESRRLMARTVCDSEAFVRLLNECGVPGWDGFQGKHPKFVKDGEMFSFEAVVDEGRRIRASGSENFPRGFHELRRGLAELLKDGKVPEQSNREASERNGRYPPAAPRHCPVAGIRYVFQLLEASYDMRSTWLMPAAAVAIVLILAFSYAVRDVPGDGSTFVILHSNDTHCYYDQGLGMSTLGALKDSYESQGETVFVDAGDFLQGRPSGTVTAGLSSIEVMNSIGYDVGIPGNHEFDFGFPVLLERADALNYPIICSNLVYPDGSSVFKEWIVLEKNGVRLGIFGLLTPDTAYSVKAGSMGGTSITDPIEASERMVALLRTMEVDMVVAIGHIGVEPASVTSDEICAKVPGIDIFIDGHSHTAMKGGRAPGIDLLPSGTVIASTGGHCTSFGVVRVHGGTIDADLYEGEPLSCPETNAAVAKVNEECGRILSTSIGSTRIPLEGNYKALGPRESMLGDLIADAARWFSGSDVAMLNSGSIRSDIGVGDITISSLYEALPFLDELVILEADGSRLYEAMESSYTHLESDVGGFLQISGMTVTYDPDAETGSRVSSIEIDGKKVEAGKTYSVCTSDYVVMGGNGNSAFAGCAATFVEESGVVLGEYIKSLGTVTESSIETGRQIALRSPSDPLIQARRLSARLFRPIGNSAIRRGTGGQWSSL